MKKAKANKSGLVVIKVDKSLDQDMNKYLGMSPFKEKLEKANHILKTYGLPKFPK